MNAPSAASEDVTALATIIRHRDTVRLNVKRLVDELSTRALAHDLSKLAPDELNGFVRIGRAAREHAYGSDEYRASMDAEKGDEGCITLHYARNSHHPEHHPHPSRMGWLDIIEMVLDWKAASETYGKMTLRDGLVHHRERFAFTPAQWWLIEEVVGWLEPQDADVPDFPPDRTGYCAESECLDPSCQDPAHFRFSKDAEEPS